MSTVREQEAFLAQFVDVRVEYLVHETYTGGFEGVLVGKFYVDLPHATRKRGLSQGDA